MWTISKDIVGKCPKCGGEMKDGRLLFMWGDRIRHIIDDDGIQAYCGKCGFIVSKYLQIANKKEDAKPQ